MILGLYCIDYILFAVTSKGFLGIPFLAGSSGAEARKDIIMITIGTIFSYMYEWHGQRLFTMENKNMNLSIILNTVLGENSFKITLKFLSFLFIWDANLGSHTG